MKGNLHLREVYIALLSGWIVVVFSEPYFNIKNALMNKFPHNPGVRVVLEIFLPTVGFLLMIVLVQIAFRIKKKRNSN